MKSTLLAFNSMPAPEILADAAWDLLPFILMEPNSRIIASTPLFSAMCGFSETELQGKLLTDLLAESHKAKSNPFLHHHIQLRKKSGQTFWVEVKTKILNLGKIDERLLVFFHESNENIKIEKHTQKIRDEVLREHRTQQFLMKQLCYDLQDQLRILSDQLMTINLPKASDQQNVIRMTSNLQRMIRPLLNLHGEVPTDGVINQKSNQIKILVVDDVDDNIVALGVYFKNLGLPFQAARSGEQALEFFKQSEFELVLIDIHMPGMGGLELAQKIREHESQNLDRAKSHLAALTAQDTEEDRTKCFEAGFDMHFVKPMTKRQLVEYLIGIHFIPQNHEAAA